MLNLTPKWEPIFLENLQGTRRIAIDSSCPPTSSTILTLALDYFEKQLNIDSRSTQLHHLISLTERDIPKATAMLNLKTLLKKTFQGWQRKYYR